MSTNCTVRLRNSYLCGADACARCGWNAEVLAKRRRTSVLIRGADGLYRLQAPKP